ncbi:MAG TPA: hypothetical protein VFI25_15455 [Planctomycetota bacterium]|jgi:hypothetical protein|nr:hypothetical protein [Planctomycetota bacterium]
MTRTIRLLGLPLLLASVSCATRVGHWTPAEFRYSMNRDALRKEVSASLEKAGWATLPGRWPEELRAVKAAPGGHRTIADFRFVETEKGSGFHLAAGSQHVVNFLTFGILGLSTQQLARRAIHEWLEEWNRSHPKES